MEYDKTTWINGVTKVNATNMNHLEEGVEAANEAADQAIAALAGKADLVDGKVPATELPSYVDDVVEYPLASDFPVPGESGKIYVATETNLTYRWSGTQYIQIGGQDLSQYYTKDESDAKFETIEAHDQSVEALSENFAPAYDSTKTYKVGDLCVFNAKYYICTTAVSTAEAFDPLKWTATDIFDSLKGKFVRILNASDINSSALTEEQFEAFKQGVIVKGTLSGILNGFFLPAFQPSGSMFWGGGVMYVASPTGGNKKAMTIKSYSINPSPRSLSVGSTAIFQINLGGSANILFGKNFPDYPEDTSKAYAFEQNVGGNLAWNEKTEYGFQVIDPPASTTLTTAEVALFEKGVAIRGSFLGLNAPTFMPAAKRSNDASAYYGFFFGAPLNATSTTCGTYKIDASTSIISIYTAITFDSIYNTNHININKLTAETFFKVLGKNWPSYPSDTTKLYKLQQQASTGALAWVQDFNQVTLSQADYDDMATHDDNVFYCIPEE